MSLVFGVVAMVFPLAVPLLALFGAMLLIGLPIDQSLGVVISVSVLAVCGMVIGSLISDFTGFKGIRRTLQFFGASLVVTALWTDGGFWTLVTVASDLAVDPTPRFASLLLVATTFTALLAKTAVVLSASTVAMAAPLSMLGRVHFPEFREVLNALIPVGVVAAAVLLLSYIIEGLAV